MANAELQAAIDEMTATTTAATTEITSAIAFINGANGVISTLREELERLGATPEQIALVRDAETQLEASKDALAAALLANTPSASRARPTP